MAHPVTFDAASAEVFAYWFFRFGSSLHDPVTPYFLQELGFVPEQVRAGDYSGDGRFGDKQNATLTTSTWKSDGVGWSRILSRSGKRIQFGF